MALYLPVRAVSRSQRLRIGTQTATKDTTIYVDISDIKTRRDLEHHQAIGALIVVGSLTPSNGDGVVVSGAVIDQGSSATDLALAATAGEVKTRSTGVHAAVAVSTTVTITAADATNPRIDIVVADLATGAITVIAGTAAVAPVAPVVPGTKVPLARVAVAANTTAIVNANITDIRPRP